MDLWPLGVYVALVLGLVGAMLGLSYVLGQRHHDRSTDSPYESGILSEGSARVRPFREILPGRDVLRYL